MYELQITIKEGVWTSPYHNSALYVETSVDGKIDENDRTAIIKVADHKVIWDKTIVKHFTTLEPATPIMISMSMYKKRFFKDGYKLVGTAHLSLYELIPILNKGTAQGRILLNTKKNHTAEAHFVVAINLQSISTTSNTTPGSIPSKVPTSSQAVPVTVRYASVASDIEAEVRSEGAVEVTKKQNFMSTSTQFGLLLAIIFISITNYGLYQVLLH